MWGHHHWHHHHHHRAPSYCPNNFSARTLHSLAHSYWHNKQSPSSSSELCCHREHYLLLLLVNNNSTNTRSSLGHSHYKSHCSHHSFSHSRNSIYTGTLITRGVATHRIVVIQPLSLNHWHTGAAHCHHSATRNSVTGTLTRGVATRIVVIQPPLSLSRSHSITGIIIIIIVLTVIIQPLETQSLALSLEWPLALLSFIHSVVLTQSLASSSS
jgi:hypothetical protein